MSRVEFLDHTADSGIRARGRSIGDVFSGAARGLFSLMIDPDRVMPRERHEVRVSAETLEGLLVEWLANLLAEKDLSGLVFGRFKAKVEAGEGGFRLRGSAWGEELDVARHAPKLEVKGISYLGLRVARVGDEWLAECVLDV
jgi:SHS2 domain-containing protein